MTQAMNPKQAHKAILRGEVLSGLVVEGNLSFTVKSALTRLPENLEVSVLNLYSCDQLRALPRGLRCEELIIRNSALTWLPQDLHVSKTLILEQCPYLESLPYGLRVQRLTLRRCKSIKRLPYGFQVGESLDIEDCANLESLPTQLKLHSLTLLECDKIALLPSDLQVSSRLIVRDCVSLESVPPLTMEALDLIRCLSLRELPDGLRVRSLNVSGCVALERWPGDGIPGLRRLSMRGCIRLRSLPPGVWRLDELDIRDCESLRALPERLRIMRSLDIGGAPLRSLPLSDRGFRLRWRGVPISGRIIFHPETITVEEALAEPDVEVRRVMLERMGYERFLHAAGARARHQDEDAGGMRQLLELSLPGDEPLVCLAVRDPSTGKQYLIRVPPWMRTCHQAAAWIAGFDDPDDYYPVAET
ncbi:MAG TPA: hypothetical protein VKQ36_09310 [Ktedonobacterales bacterium]|nr:hypothetical protein [Ktedonobacterales bacterium]